MRSGRFCSPVVVSATSLNGLAPSSRFPGFADALGVQPSPTWKRRCSSPATSTGSSPISTGATGRSSTGSSRWDRELARARAADLVASELGAWGWQPVFAYGFEDFTGARVDGCSRRSPGAADVIVSLPTSPCARPSARSAHRRRPGAARRRAGRRVARAIQGWYDSAALAHLERTLFEERRDRSAAARRGRALPRSRRSARVRRAGGARRSSTSSAAACPPTRSPSSCPASTGSARRSRPPSAPSGFPYSYRGAALARRTPFGPRAPRAAALRLARWSAARALHVPPFSLLGPRRAPAPTSSRGGCAARGIKDPARRRGEPSGCSAIGRPPCASCRDEEDPLGAARALAAG